MTPERLPLIEFKNVSKHYDNHIVVSEMNYRVKVQGESAENVARDYLEKNGFLQSTVGFGKVVVINE